MKFSKKSACGAADVYPSVLLWGDELGTEIIDSMLRKSGSKAGDENNDKPEAGCKNHKKNITTTVAKLATLF